MSEMTEAGCRGCGAELPPPFLDLGRTPLANAYVRPEEAGSPEPIFRLAVSRCGRCDLVQLTESVSPAEMFHEYAYFSSYSDSFTCHARLMAANLIERFQLGNHSRVIEIASNDGYLLRHFRERGIGVLGVEPARNVAAVARDNGVPTLVEFFNSATSAKIAAQSGLADLIIGNNVLAHVPNINDFMAGAASLLKITGAAVFEVPYLRDLLDHGEFDTIYHEHVFYFSLNAIARLAARAGLEVYDVEPQAIHGGSLRVFLQHANARGCAHGVMDLLIAERREGLLGDERYREFGAKVESIKLKLLRLLNDLRAGGKRIAAYGAPAKGNTLLNFCGIGTPLIEFTVDRNPYKQGCMLPGSHVPIHPPPELLRRRPDYALILPWNIKEEVIEQQRDYLLAGGRFIVPVPEPHVV
jgi:predicted TPR repeat methyltransferase